MAVLEGLRVLQRGLVDTALSPGLQCPCDDCNVTSGVVSNRFPIFDLRSAQALQALL